MKRIVLAVLFLIATQQAFSHHNWSVDYDRESMAEIEGTISSIKWRNPHVGFEIIVNAGSDTEQRWSISGTSVSSLARMDVNRDILKVGDVVRMAGHLSRKSEFDMYMIHLLLPDGREAVFSNSAEPRWSGERVGSSESIRGNVIEEDIEQRPDSIFAVWTIVMGVAESRILQPGNTEDFLLTDAARQRIASYDPIKDNPFGNCSPKGIPAVMDAPYPVELVDEGDVILFKLEEYDAVRKIHLREIHDDSAVESSLLGYSTGRWQGDTLLITTTKIDYPFLHVGSQPSYIPQSEYVQTQETLRLSDDRNRLYYSLVVTDTMMLSEPMVFSKYYQWRPGESLQPYLCDEG